MTSPTEQLDSNSPYKPLIDGLLRALLAGDAVALIGSGASLPADRIATELADAVDNEGGIERETLNLTTSDRHVLSDELYGLIAQLPIRTFITTNYDQMLERAFDTSVGTAEKVLNSYELAESHRTINAPHRIVKLHGDSAYPPSLHRSSQPLTSDLKQSICARTIVAIAVDSSVLNLLRETLHSKEWAPKNIFGIGVSQDSTESPYVSKHSQGNTSVHYTLTTPSGLRQVLAEVIRQCESSRAVVDANERRQLLPLELYKTSIERNARFIRTIAPERRTDGEKLHWPIARMSSPEVPRSHPASHIAEACAREQRIVILGARGTGKTTLATSVAHHFAKAPWAAKHCPVLITPRDLGSDPPPSMEALLRRVASRASLPREQFLNAANHVERERRLLLIFDGLDDYSGETRNSMLQWVMDLTNKHPATNYLVTLRPDRKDESRLESSWHTLRLAHLTDDYIAQFVKDWYADSSTSDSLLSEIQSNPNVSNLCRRPLHLTLLTRMWDGARLNIRNTFELYDRFLGALLGKSANPALSLPPRGPIDSSLPPALLAMASHHITEGTLTYDVGATIHYRIDTNAAVKDQSVHATTLEAIERATGIIEQVDTLQWRFLHSSFAEFLAAKFIVESSDNDVLQALEHTKEQETWRKPIEWIAGSTPSRSTNERLDWVTDRLQRRGRPRRTLRRPPEMDRPSN